MTAGARVLVWTMRVDSGLPEARLSCWHELLDAAEQARAARFVFARNRGEFVAAHVLTRTLLSTLMPGTDPGAWRFVAGENGKPVACLGDWPAPISFNLSHTDGMVGVAALAAEGHALGFDVEPLDRKVTLGIADRYFCPEEVDWLQSLPEAIRPAGFLRLWTLKEAFIKATGQGLRQDLAMFWFKPMLPRIHFKAGLTERPEDWWFEQQVISGRFIAAVGVNRPADTPVTAEWTAIDPSDPKLAQNGQGSNAPLLRTLL
jgi:4'-phosphopantetheinyl transferase